MTGRVVIAVGGNSLIEDPKHPEIAKQWEAVYETCLHVAQLIRDGWRVVITHGNGPQVGYELRRVELAAKYDQIHLLPLDIIGAETQGEIGYMLQQAMSGILQKMGLPLTVLTIITQTRVEANDPAFERPTKPVGGFMSQNEARQFESEGWQVVEDVGRGWRRVVASPLPREIIELPAIQRLIEDEFVVIACGGGGIPVTRDVNGNLQGVNAVIDKDLASSLLARDIDADLFVISTGVEKVALNYNRPNQEDLDCITLEEAERYIEAGHFAAGSMLPKIQAALEFIRGGGKQAIITNPQNITRALRGETGTRIVAEMCSKERT
jgi:carbamate kinase